MQIESEQLYLRLPSQLCEKKASISSIRHLVAAPAQQGTIMASLLELEIP